MSKLASKKTQIVKNNLLHPRLIQSNEQEERIFVFGPFHLDTSERVLTRGEDSIQLTPKAFDILFLLVENRGRLVSKSKLMDAIWPDTFVEEKTLTQNIFTLRKALGRDQTGEHYIETVTKHGYRFRAEVSVAGEQAADESKCTADESERSEYASISPQHVMPAPQSPASQVSHLPESLKEARTGTGPVNWKLIIPLSISVAALIAVALVIIRFVHPGGGLAKSAFQKISIKRLINSGNISAVALAPDGKYVAYAAINGDKQSLFIRRVETTSVVEIVPPAPVGFRGITFSRDGAWVYYVTVGKNSPLGTLFRVPLLGGTSQKVLQENVDSRIEFSPDGKQMVFVQWTDRSHTALVVANVDGTGKRQLATLDYENGFSIFGPAWSPDGKTILTSTQSYNGKQPFASIIAVNVEDGRIQTLLGNKWNWIGQLTWLADGSGIILTAWNGDSEVMSDQIWLMTYPAGETRRLTNDVDGYLGVSMSADARVIAASDSIPAKNFWVTTNGDWTQARKITNGLGELYSERFGLMWTPDGRIVYSTRQNGNPDVWMMEADGTQQKQLTFDSGADFQPTVSPDARYIVFVSSRTGKNQLWRMNADGGNPLLLASTEGVNFPSISPDGQWVVYEGNLQGRAYIWRVPIDGGAPTQLTQGTAFLPSVSPDGKLIACLLPNEDPGPGTLSLISLTDGHVVKQFETLVPRSTPALRWSPDGRSLTYVLTYQGVSNIWSQPIDGGAPTPLTDWKSDLIYRFDWSRDGRLLCERGTTMSNIILIQDAGGE